MARFYRIILLGLSLLFVVDSFLLGFLLFRQSPVDSPNTVIYFYLLFFVFCLSLFTILGYLSRRIFGSVEYSGTYLKNAFRQSVFLAFMLGLALLFAKNNLLNLYNALFLLLAVIFLELFFSSK